MSATPALRLASLALIALLVLSGLHPMFMALVGAVAALLLLTRLHDRQIAALAPRPTGQELWRNPGS
jgi:hypothetical protein